jgi:DNA-binding MarR family transcriptional regulator
VQDYYHILTKTIGKTAKIMGAYANDRLKEKQSNLTKVQFIVLKILSEKEDIPQHELAYITERDKTSLTRLMNTLERKGLITRKSCKQDKRIKQVSITDHGRRMVNEVMPIIKSIGSVIGADIPVDDIKTTIKVLEQVQANINAQECV